jgi:TPR repeat protein
VDAQFNLGMMLKDRGDVEAEAWLRKAAETGNTAAQYNLGLLLNDRGDVAEAEAWWRRMMAEGPQ